MEWTAGVSADREQEMRAGEGRKGPFFHEPRIALGMMGGGRRVVG